MLLIKVQLAARRRRAVCEPWKVTRAPTTTRRLADAADTGTGSWPEMTRRLQPVVGDTSTQNDQAAGHSDGAADTNTGRRNRIEKSQVTT